MSVNWTGTINATTLTGTADSGTTTTLTLSTAGWTVNGHANKTLVITGGTGVGQEAVISSNTATVLTFATLATAPDATSTFKIVLRIYEGDHFTGTTTFNGNYVEVEDSATAYVDGAYTLRASNDLTKFEMAKSETTYATFEANNYSTTARGSWNFFDFRLATGAPTPQFSYIKLKGCANMFYTTVYSSELGDMSWFHHIYHEGGTSKMLFAGTVDQDLNISNLMWSDCRAGGFSFPATVSGTIEVNVSDCWMQKGTNTFAFEDTGPARQVVDCCVVLDATGSSQNADAGKEFMYNDSYFFGNDLNSATIVATVSTGSAGTHRIHNCYYEGASPVLTAYNTTASFYSSFNDYYGNQGTVAECLDIRGGDYFDVAESDNDYMAGFNGAVPSNADTSESTSSTETPTQYLNLSTARTNARSTVNKPRTTDNVSEGTPTSSEITITYDSTNGAPTATTVNADSASGQKVLNIADIANFVAGETIEIGYGTAREEEAVISSISGGDDSFAVSLLHFDGSDASTTFTDESGKTWTANGDAQLDTAEKKFGTASGLFDGTGDYIDTPDSADFDFGSGEFTIDFWMKTTQTADAVLFGQASSGGANVTVYGRINDTTDKFTTYVDIGGGSVSGIVSSTSVNDGSWHHIAIVRSENTLKLYIDGTSEGTPVTGLGTITDRAYKFAIGRLGEYNGLYYNGHIDEFRVSKGVARWTVNFSPPTAEYGAGGALNLKENLTYTHTSAQADNVQKQVRHSILPFIKYGTVSGEYTMSSNVPPKATWGELFTGIITEYNGRAVSFGKTGHSVTLDSLKGGTTYYYKCCGYLPDGTLVEGTEGDFTTSSAGGGGGETAVGYFG